jgi:hypothetical protein
MLDSSWAPIATQRRRTTQASFAVLRSGSVVMGGSKKVRTVSNIGFSAEP